MDRNLLRLSAAALLIATAGASACAPVRTYSGFRPDYNNREITQPQVGVDTKDTVQERFGTPSTQAVLDQTAWYYISENQEQVAFYSPRVTSRRVMVVKFDTDNKVSAVENFGIERGRIVAYSHDATPTRGRELGILEQLFGNIGSTPPIHADEEDQGGRPRRDR
ncbi:MAG TPA: outer membrane protein assembly factor BamE [Caulobacterales bacterium]|nr:outer membrane protein assembly factor BamE [Caulobacterales bacterium]